MGVLWRSRPSPTMKLLIAACVLAVASLGMHAAANCVLCSTCGGNFRTLVAEVVTGEYLEFGSDCDGSLTYASSDNAYVCCDVTRGWNTTKELMKTVRNNTSAT